MEIHSYTVLHYGLDYLYYALSSVYPLVDQLHVVYTPHPSHGTRADIPPIESRDDLIEAAFPLRDKLRWYDLSGIYDEGPQRDYALDLCRKAGADIVLVVDYDEVWHEAVLREALDFVSSENQSRNWLINFTHLWRSFNWCCRDENWPVRIIDLRQSNNDTGYIPAEFGEIYHFGYAVRDEIMRYKWQIHGHKAEMRENWFSDKWDKWPPPDDCHPTNDKGFWMPEPFDKEQLPVFMRAHPFYDLERIK